MKPLNQHIIEDQDHAPPELWLKEYGYLLRQSRNGWMWFANDPGFDLSILRAYCNHYHARRLELLPAPNIATALPKAA